MSAYAIVPVTIQTFISNIYDDAPEWLSSVTYAKDDVVKVGVGFSYNGQSLIDYYGLYQSLVNGNLNNSTGDDRFWVYIGRAAPAYSASTVYGIGNRVSYGADLYQSLIDGNFANNLDNTPNWIPIGKAEYAQPLFYDAAFTYSLNDYAGVYETDIYGSTSYGFITVYRSLQAANVGRAPASSPTWWVKVGITYPLHNESNTYIRNYRVTDSNKNIYQSSRALSAKVPLQPSNAWIKVGATNKYAMFDNKRTTQTVSGGVSTAGIVVSFVMPPNINAVAFLGLESSLVTVTITNAASAVVYSKSVSTLYKKSTSWTEWFFGGLFKQPSLVLLDLPLVSGYAMTVTIVNSIGAAKCGHFVAGNQVLLGDIQYGAESDGANYSTIDRDFSGEITTITQRRSVPKAINQIFTDKKNVAALRKLRADYSATPLVWVGLPDASDEYSEALLVNGIYRRFTINLQYTTHAVVNLELEEI